MARAFAVVLALSSIAPAVFGGSRPVLAVRAVEGWRAEFDAVCAKTQGAMALPTGELESLIARCDRLMPEIEKLDSSTRKVFSTRLLACRNLYAYVLESRRKS